MTRTERASSIHALIKDRSVARNGRDKGLKKGGAHGWGSMKDELMLENGAFEDEAADVASEELESDVSNEDGQSEMRLNTLGDVSVVFAETNKASRAT